MFSNWFKMIRPHSTQPARGFRPRLESLECRFAPAVVVWDGGGADNNWTTAANWVGDTVPAAGDKLVFDHGTPGIDLTSLTNTNNFAAGTNFNSLHFFGAPPPGQRFVLGGNQVSLGAAGIIHQAIGGTDQINLPLHFSATTNIRIDIISSVGSTFVIEGAISGPGGFVKRGNSALSLRGGQANSYTGATLVEQGTMVLERTSVDGAIPNGALTIGNGVGSFGSVVLARSQQLGNNVALTIHAGSSFALSLGIFEVMGGVSGSGSLFINNSALNVGADNGTAIFTGTIHGGTSGFFVKVGTGTQVLGGSSPNPLAGIMLVNQGRLVLGKTPGIDAFRGNRIVVGDGLGGTNADQLVLTSDNQIADTSIVRLVSSGVFDVNSHGDAINRLTVDTGNVIDTGGAGSLQVNTLEMTSGFVNLNGAGLRLNGNATINASNNQAVIGGRLEFVGAPRTFTVADGAAGFDLVVSATLAGTDMVKAGPGMMLLSGSSPLYTGTTTVADGFLYIRGSIASSPVIGQADGLVMGDGMTGTLTVLTGGVVNPGVAFENSGILTTKDLNLNAGSSFIVDLRTGTTPGTGHDQIAVTGTVDIAGSHLALNVWFLSAHGDRFVIIDNDGTDSVNGTFVGTPEGSIRQIGGRLYRISYVGGTGNDVELTTVSAGLIGGNLWASGTDDDDTMQFSEIGPTGMIEVYLNGVLQGTFTPTANGKIIAHGHNGNDSIQVSGGIQRDARLFGGAGNDTLEGGAGDDVLVGGGDNDEMRGGQGRDLLLGGAGADPIIGNADEDILVSGTTAFDANQAALDAIMAEWTSSRSYASRVANLRGDDSNPEFGSRANGSFFLKTDGLGKTVFDDQAADTLTGAGGQDWFFANTDLGGLDIITGLTGSELVDDLD